MYQFNHQTSRITWVLVVTLQTKCCVSLYQNGTVQCEAISCPPPQCPAGTAPAYVKGACCKECQREWSTLNLSTLLHSHNHGHNCAQTRTHNSKTTSITRFRAHITPPQGLPDNWPGLCCVAKLPPNMSLEMSPSFLHIHGPINYSLAGFQNTDGHQSHRHEPINLVSLHVM